MIKVISDNVLIVTAFCALKIFMKWMLKVKDKPLKKLHAKTNRQMLTIGMFIQLLFDCSSYFFSVLNLCTDIYNDYSAFNLSESHWLLAAI